MVADREDKTMENIHILGVDLAKRTLRSVGLIRNIMLN